MRSPDGRLFDVTSPDQLAPPDKTCDRPQTEKTRPWILSWWLWAAPPLVAAALGLAIWHSSTLVPPSVQSDPGCPSPPGLYMPFARIPEGEFTMGKSRGPEGERPEHLVQITKPFCIGKFEVTQRQWKSVMGDNPSSHHADDRPVEGVSWKDVQLFLGRLNHIDPSGRYRLPTEAEWEHAAVSGGGSPNPEDVRHFGNCRGWLDFYNKTAPVGRFRPNAHGIYDLYGNVAEWVSDWYGPYSRYPMTDPNGPATGTEKVRRGGFFGNSPENCSTTHRAPADPNRRAEDTGLRVVRDPVKQRSAFGVTT
jgi:formylglycine-generating enzyme required for sulfatase activity